MLDQSRVWAANNNDNDDKQSDLIEINSVDDGEKECKYVTIVC